MSIDTVDQRSHERSPSLPVVLLILAWAAVVYIAYAVSYLD
jgi:hypothetical protein